MATHHQITVEGATTATIPIAYSCAMISGAEWAYLPDGGFKVRDLRMAFASEGWLNSQHIKATTAGKARTFPPARGSRFYVLFIWNGSLEAEIDGKVQKLKSGDCLYGDIERDLADISWSADFEAYDIAVPKAQGAASGYFNFPVGKPQINFDRPEAYARAEGGPRSFFYYRHLGTAQASEGKIHLQHIKTAKLPPGGTGWHKHSMAQIFIVLNGACLMQVDGVGDVAMKGGDAMCLADDLTHNLALLNKEYELIELCIPGNYETIPQDRPKNYQSFFPD